MEAPDPVRLLIATDNHLGYAEKDPIRGDDSFRTFQEILQHAKRERVDCILLAGDLFHDNKPSRNTLYQTIRLLRSHCMGDHPIQFQILSDQSINFPNFGIVNYEDPNFNIELPIFSIHGNHDDPSREFSHSKATDLSSFKSLAALDLLSASNLINYFGKADRVDLIEIFPILLRKHNTHIAVYGLGNIRDERLYRMFEQDKVTFHRPAEEAEVWFNIFLVHQNRENKGRGSKNCLLESMIPGFIDLVIWGHEHECVMELKESVVKDFFILQPGSSVATSLVEGEAKEKKIAIVEVMECKFRQYTRKLETVRPFEIGEIVLSEVRELDRNDPDIAAKMESVLVQRVEELIERVEGGKELMLVRLRVEHSGFPVLHNQRFGARFVGKVANANDILLFHRKRKKYTAQMSTADQKWKAHAPIPPSRLDTVTIESLLERQLHLQDRKLCFLPEDSMAQALEEYVVKKIPSAIEDAVNTCLEKTQRRIFKDKKAKNRDEIVEMAEKQKDRADAEVLAKAWDEKEEKQVQVRQVRPALTSPPKMVSEVEEDTPKKTAHRVAQNWGRKRKESVTKLLRRPVRASRSPPDSDSLSFDSDVQVNVDEYDIEEEEEACIEPPRPKRTARVSNKTPAKPPRAAAKKAAKPQRSTQSLLGFGLSLEQTKPTASKRARQGQQDSEDTLSFTQPRCRKLPLSLLQSSQQSSQSSNASISSISKRNWGQIRRL